MPNRPNVRGVYLITPDEPNTQRLLLRTAPLLGSITWLQYRNKQADAALRLRQAGALREACGPCPCQEVPDLNPAPLADTLGSMVDMLTLIHK